MSFEFSTSGTTVPGAHATDITPADADLVSGHLTRGVYVGGTGDLAVMMGGDEGDNVVLFTNVQAGSLLPIRVKQIRSTNTTATSIVAIW